MKNLFQKLKLNNKGYTLVEIIAAVTVIGILSGSAIFSGFNTMNKAHIDYCTQLSDNMVVAARDYFNDNRLLLPNDYGKTSCVTLEKLIEKKYIEPMQDYDHMSCTDPSNPGRDKNKVCTLKETNTTYFYNSVLSCNKCISANSINPGTSIPNITYNPNNSNVNNKDINVTITLTNSDPDKKIISYKYQVYKIPSNNANINTGTMVMGSTDYKKYTGNPKVKLTEKGYYKIVTTAINEDGKSTEKQSGTYHLDYTFVNNDKCATDAVNIVAKQVLDDGTTNNWNSSEWHNKKLVVTLKKKGNVESYTVAIKKKDCKTKTETECEKLSWSSWKTIKNTNKNYEFSSEKTNSILYQVKVTAYDGEGGSCTYTKEYYQDNVKPTCKSSYQTSKVPNYPNGSQYKEKWTNKDKFEVYGKCDVEKGGSGCNTSKDQKSIINTDTKNDRFIPGSVFITASKRWECKGDCGYVFDKAGNKSAKCSGLVVRRDKTLPNCSSSYTAPSGYSSGKWTNLTIKIKGTCTDPKTNNVASKCTGNLESSFANEFVKTVRPGSTNNTGTCSSNCGYVYDKAGNKKRCGTLRVQIDKTKPRCTSQASNFTAGTWTNQSTVKLVGKCTDPNGSVVSIAKSGCKADISTGITVDMDQNVRPGANSSGSCGSNCGYVYDNAGNKSARCTSLRVKRDTKNPVCNGSSGGNSSWQKNGSVTIKMKCKDNKQNGVASGCTETTYSKSLTNQGKKHKYNWTDVLKDKAGNKASGSNCIVTYNKYIDKTAPSITNINNPSGNCPHDSKWHKNNYTVTLKTAGDPDAGTTTAGHSGGIYWMIDGNRTCSGETTCRYTVSTEGHISHTAKVCDKVGNCSSKTFDTYLDKTGPTSTVSGLKCDASASVGSWHAYITLSVKDSYSGIYGYQWHVWDTGAGLNEWIPGTGRKSFSGNAGTGCVGPKERHSDNDSCEVTETCVNKKGNTKWTKKKCKTERTTTKYYSCNLNYSLTNYTDMCGNGGSNNSGSPSKTCDIETTTKTIRTWTETKDRPGCED